VQHALTELKLTAVTKPADDPAHEIRADACVVGAGIAGLSAAIESAQLGPCAAMGAAAAHALDLAGGGSTHDIDLDRLHDRLAPNLG
jgi:ribulose 1,5-bisphosphate synthetase/thiazole synthase